MMFTIINILEWPLFSGDPFNKNYNRDIIPLALMYTLGFISRLILGCQKLFYAEPNNHNRVNVILFLTVP